MLILMEFWCQWPRALREKSTRFVSFIETKSFLAPFSLLLSFTNIFRFLGPKRWRRHQPVTGVLPFMTLKASLPWGRAELWARWAWAKLGQNLLGFLYVFGYHLHFQTLRTSLQASTVSPLVTIVIPYPGSYSGPWLNSEHLAAALAAAVFYLAFSSRYSITLSPRIIDIYVLGWWNWMLLLNGRLHNAMRLD